MEAPPPAPLDVQAIAATLRGGKASDKWVRSWLLDTCADPERFLEGLYAFALSKRKGLKSRRGLVYDFYHDLVVANLEQRTPALFVKDGAGYAPISYAALHERCTSLAAVWKRLGCERGKSICLVMPVGLEYAVAVLTGLRMGLVITTIEPYGPAYVKSRLEALAPEFVVTSERVATAMRLPIASALPVLEAGTGEALCPVCGSPCETPAGVLPVVTGGRETGAPTVASYAPDDPVFSLLSPFGENEEPVEITAGALHASLLRDGLVVLALEPSDVLAAPGFDPVQTSPHLLLAALAAGACYAVIDAPDLEGDPKLAERARLSILGVSSEMRERILARGADWFQSTGRAWFKDLSHVLDAERWDELGKVLAGKKIAGFNVFVNAATGGAELFSPRATPPVCLRAWPVPGRTFQLSEVAGGDLSALNDMGVYTVMVEDEPAELPLPRMLLTAREQGYLFVGTIDLGPDAQTYPRAEIAKVAAQLPAVRHASVVLGPGLLMNDARTVLVVFTDDARDPDGRIRLPVTIPEIKARIAAEMGERFVPERIAIYPLRPRLVKGEIDDAWCRSQFLNGSLDAMARSEAFVLLSRIGYILAGGAPGE
jgi:hypothetical protein